MSVAAPAPQRLRPRRSADAQPREARAAGRRQARSAPKLTGGMLWVLTLAALFGGIVALNVATLRANLQINHLQDAQQQVQAQNDLLESRVALLSGPARIDVLAARMGMVQATPSAHDFLRLKRLRRGAGTQPARPARHRSHGRRHGHSPPAHVFATGGNARP
ncbi:MAG: hypothetical protein ACXVYV_05390 [Gaiellales bacterium]